MLSGDSIAVSIDGVNFTVRYTRIDAPDMGGKKEPGQYFSLKAKHINDQWVLNKVGMLVKDITDVNANGSLLRYVYVES